MASLGKSQRNELAKTVLAARTLAEDAAAKALHTLGVDESDAPGHLDNDGRALRRSLRAQAKQLGDGEDPHRKGCYQIRHLSERLAYDHWHRLLFARFLAENDMLISPEHGVGVSLSDCNELAPELGLRDGWEVAAKFAANMLPQIFRADDPTGAVTFAPEDRVALRKLVTDLPQEIFLADDALGWVYQFWQEQRKEEVNESGDKIGADELSPVTQLFTEDYMVLFLLHNTLGAWWAGKNTDNLAGCKSEEECRQAVALPGIDWTYLRFIKDEKTEVWRPAAGIFDGWPKGAKDLHLLDPCMGSGHFLVFELPILVAMRMAEDGMSEEEAVEAVLRDNLFGLELDPRCTQIAAFNLALAAWKLVGRHCNMPPMNLACCGLAINAKKEDWVKLAGNDTRLREGMDRLFDLFQKAPDLGSLINPRKSLGEGDLLQAGFHDLIPLLEKALANDKADERIHEMAVVAHGLAKSAEILAGQFTLVTTNVPYLTNQKQDEVLREFCTKHHPKARNDLATVFLERCLAFCIPNGAVSVVMPQNWLFLTSYRALREKLLISDAWRFIARLGPGAFETISGEVVKAILLTMSCGFEDRKSPPLIAGFDVASMSSPSDKATALINNEIRLLPQARQLENPDARVTLEDVQGKLLDKYAYSYKGISTGDDYEYKMCFWEYCKIPKTHRFFQSTVTSVKYYGGSESVIWYDKMTKPLQSGVFIRAKEAWGKTGIMISQMGKLPPSLYLGEPFDTNAGALIPHDVSHLTAIWCFCSSPDYNEAVRRIDQMLKVTNATLVKIPFNIEHWQKVANEKYPHGLPKPYTDDPTQWIFHGHPCGSVIWDEKRKRTANGPLRKDGSVLQVAVARLLGYRWPAETDEKMELANEQHEWVVKSAKLLSFSDADGIVCISAIKGEQPAAERVRALLAAAFGKEWSAVRQAELLATVGFEGKTLDDWLRNGFFEQHCQMFHHRPFIWHIWDGHREGFNVLVNYHKLDRATLEKLTYTYLGDWIARQKAAIAAGEEGSDAKFAAAQTLKASLEKILEGENPYDIFVRWKPIEKQPIGWDPDLNDGVRLNIRPFLSVPDIGKKGAGILRWKPNINWNKDRGTDVTTAPWYKVFKGDRINDHHLTLEEKRTAREKKE